MADPRDRNYNSDMPRPKHIPQAPKADIPTHSLFPDSKQPIRLPAITGIPLPPTSSRRLPGGNSPIYPKKSAMQTRPLC